MNGGGYYYPTSSAWSGWNTITASSSTLTVLPNYATPVAAVQREKTPLEWLDAEIERVCELAR